MIITRVDGFTYKVMHNGVAVFTGSYSMCKHYVRTHYEDLQCAEYYSLWHNMAHYEQNMAHYVVNQIKQNVRDK